jgi:hypothetical protein
MQETAELNTIHQTHKAICCFVQVFLFKHGNKQVKAKSTKLYHVAGNSSECTVGTTYTYQVTNICASHVTCVTPCITHPAKLCLVAAGTQPPFPPNPSEGGT